MANKFETAAETARRWGCSEELVQRYCRERRIRGVTRLGRAWAIPVGAARPELRRGPKPKRPSKARGV